jgi:hypothetical protein
MYFDGSPITVRDVIDQLANIDGGVHSSSPKNDRQRALQAAAQFYSRSGLPGAVSQTRLIGGIAARGLRPLHDAVVAAGTAASASATSPCRLPACRVACLPMPGPRALCSRMSTHSSALGRAQTASLSGLRPEKETAGFICQHASPPRHLRLFYELCAYIKSGSPPEGLFPPGSAHSPRSSYSGLSGVRNRVRISWRRRMATGSVRRSIRN